MIMKDMLTNNNRAIDSSIVSPRRIQVEVCGYKSIINVPYGMPEERLQEALDNAYSMLVQSCYMEYILADNFLIIAKDIFVRKKIFRFNIKKFFVDCQSDIRKTMKIYKMHMDDDYYDEYSSILYGKVSDVIEHMRKLIEDKLRNLHSKCNPYIASYAIMMQNLVQQVDDTYKNVMDSLKKRYDVDLSKVFDKYRSRLAFTMVDNLLYAIMQSDADKFTDNIVNNKKILALWSEVTKRLYNPKNLKEARLSAFYSMPKEYQSLYTLNEDGTCEPKDGVSKWKKGA